ncbi:uncharacterized protein LOC110097091 isoform X2 [Dendrobium catenatum]|nr:uncharacterized protein LOC110097091 isoform X2 [Dendrobium catenatum]XP_020678986.2 uncharacterized protein LOC110097091 isoform X2 [Dendrobium catenatum]
MIVSSDNDKDFQIFYAASEAKIKGLKRFAGPLCNPYEWIESLSQPLRTSQLIDLLATELPRFFSISNSALAPQNLADMACIRSSFLLRGFFLASPIPRISRINLRLPPLPADISHSRIRCVASESGEGGHKVSARLSMMQQVLQEAEERASYAGSETAPKVTLDHVTVNFARSGGPGGQNVNKVNTKVDMRFNVQKAHWLSERVRERILQTEKNRINKDGDLVISSTKTRTQKGNIEDALTKLQEIIDSASYVPPPPSEEQKKRIQKLAAIEEQKRMQNKRALSQKKAIRRTRDSWD